MSSALTVIHNKKRLDITSTISIPEARALRSGMKGRAISKYENDLDFAKWLYLTENAMVVSGDDTIPYYDWAGYESWKAYVEREVGITIGHARKYVRVYQTYCVDLAHVFDRKKHAIQFEKLVALVNLVNETDLDRMIDSAREITASEFRALVVENWDLTKKNVGYSFPRKQDRIRKRAFSAARKIWGDRMTDSEAFIKILSDWYKKRDAQ